MNEIVGIIGIGAMGGALLKGLLNGAIDPERLLVADAADEKLTEAAAAYNVTAASATEIAEKARVIFLAVKPQDMMALIQQMSPLLKKGQLLVSVAAGIAINDLKQEVPGGVGVIRVMPNTPCLVGRGALAVSADRNVSEADLGLVTGWLANLGMVRVIPEKLQDAVTGVSGSGPAYIYLIIEALADGGVLAGLPRDLSQELAVQTVLGAAEMVKETGKHPAVLREMVTSPGGTTAAALHELEQGAMRATVQKAVMAAMKRAKELGR